MSCEPPDQFRMTIKWMTYLCVAAFLLLPVVGRGDDVTWNGSVDSNWNMPRNWSSGKVPGREVGELVVLSGKSVMPVVATPVEVSNPCSVKLQDGAKLEVCHGELMLEDLILGDKSGAAGGLLELSSFSNVNISGDLQVGSSSRATSNSYFQMMKGKLAVGGELFVGKGSFVVTGDVSDIKVTNLTLASTAKLRFDFDLKPPKPIEVKNQLSIAKGATLQIDLRNYTMGSNEIELVKFGSVTGAFDPENVAFLGLDGGVVTMDNDSLNLKVIDDVAKRSSTLWFIATGGTGNAPLDLQVNTGRRIRNLSSADLSYQLKSSQGSMVYSTRWSGSDFDGDGKNDTITFDLHVEGFAGSTYNYIKEDEGEAVSEDDEPELVLGKSSMTKLGHSSVVKGNSNGWGVGKDGDVDEGETLRFSVKNIKLSTNFKPQPQGFVSASVKGRGNHIMIFGEGDNLTAFASRKGGGTALRHLDPMLATSAAKSGSIVSSVVYKIIVSELPDFLDTEVGDYSHYPTGPTHRKEYAPASNIRYPDWSWDTLPMRAGVQSQSPLPDEAAKLIAASYPVVALGGRNTYGTKSVEEGVRVTAAKLKSYNPRVHTGTYKNAGLHHDRTAANAHFDEKEWTLYDLDQNGKRRYDKIRNWYRYNHNHPEMRKWWSDWCVARLQDPNIDSIFIDKATGGDNALQFYEGGVIEGNNRQKSYVSIRRRLPKGDILTGNVLRSSRLGGSRELMHIFNSSYSEGWKHGSGAGLVVMSRAEAAAASIQLFREASVKGMMVQPNHGNLNHFCLSSDEAQGMIDEGRRDEVIDIIREEIQLPLAYHLIYVNPYSYFGFQVSKNTSHDKLLWHTKAYIEEFRHPLGKPLGPPVRNGYIFTRSFEHVDVWLNVETEECRMTWDWMPIAFPQTVTVKAGGAAKISLRGADPQKSNLTYAVFSQPKNGRLSGNAPNLIYTPNAGFSGKDSFTFKTKNDVAKSLKATVSISIQ